MTHIVLAGLALAFLVVLASWALATHLRAWRLARALRESRLRYRLLAENAGEAVLVTGPGGVVRFASPAARTVGLRRPDELVGLSLFDLAHPSHAAALRAEHEAAIEARQARPPIDVMILTTGGEVRWYAAEMRPFGDEPAAGNVVCVLRGIDERKRMEEAMEAQRKAFEEQLFAASLTDPLTQVTNRHAFTSMLQYLVDMRIEGCLALFDIDYFRSINLHHGHAAGDQVLLIFTDLVRTLVRSDDIISRVGGGRFAILFPRATPDQVESVCRRIVATLSQGDAAVGSGTLHLTVSAGVARIADTLDDTLKPAEMALVVARAKGRDRLEMATRQRLPWRPETDRV